MTSEYDFNTPIDRRGTSSFKWDKYKDRDVIPMWVADMDFRSPPAVIEALHQRVDHGVFGYGDAPCELNDIIVSMLQSDYGWAIDSSWIVWLPGLVTGLNVTCRAIGDDGSDVLTNTPAYPPFLSAPDNSRRNLVSVPLVREDDRWNFDFDRIEKAITPQTRLFILCNPHNPTGRVFTRDELVELCRICERHDIVICSDEIHCGLILDTDKTHIPTATLSSDIADRTITLMAPSKTYNLPGLGCSFAIISNDDIRWSFRKAMSGIVPHVNVLGFTASLAAYRDSHDWQLALLYYLRTNRDILEKSIQGIDGLTMTHVEATYLAWIDTRQAGMEKPVRFLEEAGVGLSDGAYFGDPGFVRLNFGCPRTILEEALRCIRTAMEHLGKQ
ncbi:MAG: putative C-S lyase [Chloroflexi bacterium]|nr:putative C-S lyase [Chloroflexota bacterium]